MRGTQLAQMHTKCGPPAAGGEYSSEHVECLLDFSLVIIPFYENISIYDNRVWKTGLLVRSAVLKPHGTTQSILEKP